MCLFELVQNWTWGTVPDWLIALINVGIVLILLQHLKAFRFQADKLAETVKKMEESEKRATASDISNRESRQQELRAYIHTDITVKYLESLTNTIRKVQGISNPPSLLYYDVSLTNFGKTPAHKVITYGVTVIAEFGSPNEDKFISLENYSENIEKLNMNSTLGPSATSNLLIHVSQELTDNNISDLISGKGAIYIYGEIKYVDIFKQERSTKFRYVHRILEQALVFVDFNIEEHHKGNSAT